jgi:hypothetical protein
MRDETVATLSPPANFPNPDNNNQPSADEALGQIYTDIVFTCRGLDSNQLLATFVPLHACEFADPNAPERGVVVRLASATVGGSKRGTSRRFVLLKPCAYAGEALDRVITSAHVGGPDQ